MQTKTMQVANCLLQDIVEGRTAVGARIPSREQMMRKYGCSRVTVERAIESLTKAGYLGGRQGSGTFVLSARPHHEVRELRVVSGYHQQYAEQVFSELLLTRDTVGLPVTWFETRRVVENVSRLAAPGGCIVWAFPEIGDIWMLEYLKNNGIPILLINRNYAGFSYVRTDPYASIREGLTWLLIESGRNIALVAGKGVWSRPFQQERLLATFESFIALDAHLTMDRMAICGFEDIPGEIMESCERIFKGSVMPKGIFVLDRELALAFVMCAQGYGLKPGRDYKLLVFDYVQELKGVRGIGMMRQQYPFFQNEIRRWISKCQSQDESQFISEIKTELLIQ